MKRGLGARDEALGVLPGVSLNPETGKRLVDMSRADRERGNIIPKRTGEEQQVRCPTLV